MVLDYDIQEPEERVAHVRDILDHLLKPPTNADLEKMADYIICARSSKGPSPIEEGKVLPPGAHRITGASPENRITSLDAILEGSEGQICSWQRSTGRKRNPIRRPWKHADGTVDPGDSNIPGMVELWAQIDRLEANLRNETNTYKQYVLRHILIDCERQQYELRDSYNPPLTHSGVAKQVLKTDAHIDFSEDSGYWLTEDEWRAKLAASYNPRLSRNIDDYETKVTPKGVFVKWVVRHQRFDWENPRHIRALMEHYDLLEVQDGHNPDTQGYALLQDFQRYRQYAQISPMRDYILGRRLEHASYAEIRKEVEQKWGVRYNNSYLCRILTQELPRTIAQAATIHRLTQTTPENRRKVCAKCGQKLPRHSIFFGIRNDEKDGFSRICRDCTRLSLNVEQVDRRFKDITKQVGEKTHGRKQKN